MRRALLPVVLLLGLAATGAAADEGTPLELRWKLQSSAQWPPAISGDRMVLRIADTVSAYSVQNGRMLWTQRVSGLRAGEASVAAGERFVYLLGSAGLEMLDLATGKPAGKRSLSEPTGLLYQGGSIYVVGGAGLIRLDETGTKLLQKAPELKGELRGADGDFVAIYRHGKKTPKRLTVVNLRTGKLAFDFKLLPGGSHRVARMAEGRIVFLDHSVREPGGTNLQKLYYTEADYVAGKKLHDASLASKYTSAATDVFWAVVWSGKIFIANHGKTGAASTLFCFDPEQGRVLWTRSGEVASTGLLVHDGRLFTAVTKKGGATQLLGYSPESGDVTSRLPLDGAAVGGPIAAGTTGLLCRTRHSIVALGAKVATPVVTPGTGTGTGTGTGAGTGMGTGTGAGAWRMFRDRVAGYVIQLPQSWSFNRDMMRKLGGLRFVIPFVRSDAGRPLATVHVLTWEAAGRDAPGLWRSIQAQRLRTNPSLRVASVVNVGAQGGSGPPALLATYTFRSPLGEPVQMRSLCMISHGLAFELRGWVAPSAPVTVWQEVEGIFRGFLPKPPGTI
jgi:outer membrane protein assembly factor BamB